MRFVIRVNSSTSSSCNCRPVFVKKNQLPPQATSPTTSPNSGTFTATSFVPTMAWHVVDRHLATGLEPDFDFADRGFDAMLAGLQSAEIGQRRHDADHAVPAHSQVPGIVEEHHAGRRLGRDRFLQHCTDHALAAARLGHQRRPQPIGVGAHVCQPLGHVAVAEIGRTFDDYAQSVHRPCASR